MPVFTLTDIQFNTPSRRQGVRQLTEDANAYNILRYPIDLGTADKGHYMVFNINEQINTSFPSDQPSFGVPTVRDRVSPTLGQQVGDVYDLLKESVVSPIASKLSDKVNDGTVTRGDIRKLDQAFQSVTDTIENFKQRNQKYGVRTIRRIRDTIAIYMPDTLTFDHNQQYDELSSTPLDLIKSIGQRVPLLSSLINFSDTNIGRVLIAGGLGVVSNPMLEVLYRSPELRKFAFDFLIFPRSTQEALEVNKIIDMLKFHQAPELAKGTAGLFLRPPSEFDISFYYNGQINPNIPKISTCVLNKITVDYVPNGNFSAYEVPGQSASTGGTGMPVGIRLSLGFVETEYLHKGSPILSNRGLSGVGVGFPGQEIRYGE